MDFFLSILHFLYRRFSLTAYSFSFLCLIPVWRWILKNAYRKTIIWDIFFLRRKHFFPYMEYEKKMKLHIIRFCEIVPTLWNWTHSSKVSWSYNLRQWPTWCTNFNTFITVLYMYVFRAISCSSSGGQILLIQHLVSSLLVSDRPVHSTGRSLTETNDIRCCINLLAPEFYI